jgi:hypothetical protein
VSTGPATGVVDGEEHGTVPREQAEDVRTGSPVFAPDAPLRQNRVASERFSEHERTLNVAIVATVPLRLPQFDQASCARRLTQIPSSLRATPHG